jgi:hypothetical protein
VAPGRTGASQLAPADGVDAACSPDLFFLLRERNGTIGAPLRDVRDLAALRVVRQLVAVLRVLDRLGRLDDVEAEVQRVPAETQSAAGVIWSVSIASRFFPGRAGSQKMRAFPRKSVARACPPELAERAEEGNRSALAPGFHRTGSMRCIRSS